MSNYLTNTGIAKNVVVAAMALMSLGSGIFFAIKAGSNNNAIVQQWQSQDGRQKAYMTGSGSLAASGSLVGRGGLSGTTLNVTGIAGTGIGQALCLKAGKLVGYCSTTPTSGTCTCN